MKLSDIAITHISLVKAGANGKSTIYKSQDSQPTYEKTINIKKSDEEEGVVYGIVYSPDEVDSQGDFTDANEIKKAAYAFMKNRNTLNVDKEHSFENEKAFVAESWVLKENDPVFPDESVGSWAVAIKLEDDALKKFAKNGELSGLSMAGTALKQEVEKAEKKTFEISDLLDVFTKVFSSTHLNLSGSVYNDKVNKSDKEEETDLKKEDLEAVVAAAVEPLTKTVGDLQKEVALLKKSDEETKEVLKKSMQDNTPPHKDNENSTGGIL